MSRLVGRAITALILLGICAPVLAGEPSGQGEVSRQDRAATDVARRMVEAAEADDWRTVMAMLEEGVPVDATDGAGATALSFAVVNRNERLIAALLKRKADPALVNDYGIGPLLIAIRIGDGDLVRRLLRHGADPARAMWTGETPLMFAARLGHAGMVRDLIAAGAPVNASETRNGQTALMWAAAAGQSEIVDILLANGADVAARTPEVEFRDVYSNGLVTDALLVRHRGGMTALLFAVMSQERDVVERLLDAGASVNEASADGTTALLMSLYLHVNAMQTFPGDTQIVASVPIARLLLERGADPDAANESGLNPLAAASFLALGHDLRGAKQMGGIDIVEMKFQDADAEAATALLLEHGADPNQVITDYVPTVPPGADLRRPTRIANVSPFLMAGAFDKPELVRLMMETGRIDIETPRRNGDTPLMAAVRVNAFPAVKAMVDAGANAAAANDAGDTALHVLARSNLDGGAEIARYLLDHGARLDAMNLAGETPLSLAAAPWEEKERPGYGLNPEESRVQAGYPIILLYSRPPEAIPISPGPGGREYLASLGKAARMAAAR